MYLIFFIVFLNSFSLFHQDFSVEENKYFRFYFLPQNRYSAIQLKQNSERYLLEISSDMAFKPELSEKISVYILPEEADSSVADKKFPSIPDWVGGFVNEERKVIVLRSASISAGLHKNIFDIFKHELSHIILYAYVKENYSQLPWWFVEGFAMWHAREWSFYDSIFISESILRGSFIPLNDIKVTFDSSESEVRQMYTEALNFYQYFRSHFGAEVINNLLLRLREGEEFSKAFQSLTNQSLEQIEASWKRELYIKYKWVPIISSSTVFWIVVTLLFLIGYTKKKKRSKEILKKWEREDFFY